MLAKIFFLKVSVLRETFLVAIPILIIITAGRDTGFLKLGWGEGGGGCGWMLGFNHKK